MPRKVIRVTLGNISNADLILLFTKYMPFIVPLNTKSDFYIELSNEQIIIID